MVGDVDGESVGVAVGLDDGVGDGDSVGDEVAGDSEGEDVVGEDVGPTVVGEPEGAVDVGDRVGTVLGHTSFIGPDRPVNLFWHLPFTHSHLRNGSVEHLRRQGIPQYSAHWQPCEK